METQIENLAKAKDAHIDDLKQELAKNREAKEQVDADIKTLQEKITEIGSEHAENLVKSQQIMSDMAAKKDAATNSLIKMVMDNMKAIMEDTNKHHNDQMKEMIAHMKVQDNRINDILTRMDKRIEMMERARAERDGIILPPLEPTYPVLSGAELYRMVQARQEELTTRSKRSIGIGGGSNNAPFIQAAFSAIAGKSLMEIA